MRAFWLHARYTTGVTSPRPFLTPAKVLLGVGLLLLTLSNLAGVEWNRMAMGTSFVLVFLLAYITFRRGGNGTSVRWSIPVHGTLLVFLLATLLSAVGPSTRAQALSLWFTVLSGGILFVLGRAWGSTAEGLRTVVVAAATVAGLAGLAALGAGVLDHSNRFDGLMHNANALGGTMLLGIPLAIGWARTATGRARWVAYAAGVVCTLGLLVAASYTGIVSAVLVLGMTVVWFRPRVDRRVVLRGVLGFVLLLALLVGVRVVATRDLRTALNLPATISRESLRLSFTQRYAFNEAALRMIADRPLSGFGLGAFQRVYPRYAVTIGEQPRYAHNWYLELASEAGLPALAAFVAFLYLALRPAVRSVHQGVPDALRLGALLSVLAVLIHGGLDFATHFGSVAVPLWVLLGALSVSGESPAERAVSWARPFVLALAFVLFVRGVTLVGAAAMGDDAAARQRNGDAAGARTMWETSLRLDPSVDTYRALGWNWFSAREDPEALDRAWAVTERAKRWGSDDYFLYHLRGRIAYAQKDRSRAEAELANAVALDPWFHLNFLYDYATVLHESGRSVEAEDALIRVFTRYTVVSYSSNPDLADGRAHLAELLGRILQSQNRLAGAIRAYRSALEFEPGYAPALKALATLGAPAPNPAP